MALTSQERDELRRIEAQARKLRAKKNADAKERGRQIKRQVRQSIDRTQKGQRDPRVREADFEAWLHDFPCIAGLIEGGCSGPIESAHQKLAIASKGWREGGLGPRVHDARCVPLCAHHHRLAPNSCDTGGQRKFWDRLNIGDLIADFCRDFHEAFRTGGDGHAVIAKYVRVALEGERA